MKKEIMITSAVIVSSLITVNLYAVSLEAERAESGKIFAEFANAPDGVNALSVKALISESGIDDAASSGGTAMNEQDANAVPAADREEVKKDMPVTLDAKPGKRLSAEVPLLEKSPADSSQQDTLSWKTALAAGLAAVVIIPVVLVAWGLSKVRDGIDWVMENVIGIC